MTSTTYGSSKTFRDGDTFGYTISLEACKNISEIGWITFEYTQGNSSYRFWLLSECSDLAQKRIKRLLKEDGVEIVVINHDYTIVTSELYKED